MAIELVTTGRVYEVLDDEGSVRDVVRAVAEGWPIQVKSTAYKKWLTPAAIMEIQQSCLQEVTDS